MKILVTGDREWDNFPVVISALKPYPSDTILIHGACRGADLTCAVVAEELGFTLIACPAHWRHNTKDWIKVYGRCDQTCEIIVGKAAGVLRNRFMLDTHHPDRVLAFHNDLSQSTGTLDMVKRATKAGLSVDLFTYEGFIGTNPPTSKLELRQYLNSHRKESPQERFLIL